MLIVQRLGAQTRRAGGRGPPAPAGGQRRADLGKTLPLGFAGKPSMALNPAVSALCGQRPVWSAPCVVSTPCGQRLVWSAPRVRSAPLGLRGAGGKAGGAHPQGAGSESQAYSDHETLLRRQPLLRQKVMPFSKPSSGRRGGERLRRAWGREGPGPRHCDPVSGRRVPAPWSMWHTRLLGDAARGTT